ncbi:MAG: stage V sporulation protein SpoVM [Ruminococcus sp.]
MIILERRLEVRTERKNTVRTFCVTDMERCTFFRSTEYTGLNLKGGAGMKIVVVKSPRLLSGLFRMIFKIQKETPIEDR